MNPPRRILITGGTGSLGSALVKSFLLDDYIERVVVFSRDEVKQAQLFERHRSDKLRCIIGDVRDRTRLREACWNIDTIIHTAALKRIDQVSYNPSEAFQTNTQGTLNVLQAGTLEGVYRVLLISSDKAVYPVNFYGATKLMAEMITVNYNVLSYPRGTWCSVIRYGNVWGSRGSVIRVFLAARKAGLPLPVTNFSMSRFFLTLPMAVQFVRDSITTMRGGEIFVPCLRSWTVRQAVYALHGSKIKLTGARFGGEKLHEQLLTESEATRTFSYKSANSLFFVAPEISEWTSMKLDTRVKINFPYRSDRVRRVSSDTLRRATNELEEEL